MSEPKLIVLRTPEELEALAEYILDHEFLAFDTETTGVTRDSTVIGFSICADPEEAGFYVILAAWDVVEQRLVQTACQGAPAKEFFLRLLGKKLIMQNAPFDCAMILNNYGVNLMPHVHTDTLICGHLLNENRANGLKERGVELFGENARKEQAIMKDSVIKNGGQLTKHNYELYKADADLIAHYGAQDAVLTMKVFYHDVPILFEEGLDRFFYDEESMPLLRGPTFDLNTTGLRVDPDKLQKLRGELEAEIMELKAYIYKEITPLVRDEYPGTKETNTFNINAGRQLAWLLFERLGNDFRALTKGGREFCKALGLKVPYYAAARRTFVQLAKENYGEVWKDAKVNPKTGKMGRPSKVGHYWIYTACGKETLGMYAQKYKWVQKLLEYKKAEKLLGTYVIGIQEKMQYNIIRPSFLQHGTTSGRYSSKQPNFQNLPRSDKRVKGCIIARQGKVFVGADYSQLEPRVFASVSGDPTLQGCFAKGQDFYSVVGAPVYGIKNVSLFKDDDNSFAKKYPDLRDGSKVFSLATPYGRTAMQQASVMGTEIDEAQSLIDRYFAQYPLVENMMLDSHEQAKKHGVVYNLYGRPRRIPEAMDIIKDYGDVSHRELPYVARTLLNLAMNHRVQSTGASIMNRAAIAVWKGIQANAKDNALWLEVKIVLQVHDELILEGPKELANEMAALLKTCMEGTTTLPGVDLVAEPKIAYNLADLK